MTSAARHYNKAYFDKWYRHPKHKVSTNTTTTRKAAMILGVAEFFLERPVRTVLDIGCGEGQWQPILQKLRPGIRYLGVDPSEYAVGRYGKERNLKLGGFADLGGINLTKTYDLILCSDTLYYVPRKELNVGMSLIAQMLGGIAFLEAYASEEALEGDFKEIDARDAAFYRRLFRRHGLVSCGPHCYAGEALKGQVMELERGGI
ncbi:MAG TPA: class I SAM-dependent methyltransferase [Chthoniobacteraceae bacterium]|jgi:SAM-dependent methyltransferase|nr:class I SAM-dependent methyltransferase [Chthoniobacteraceae bacterium]